MSEELQHLRELHNAYTKRLRVLELKHASLGNETSPSIIIEIDELRKNIAELEPRIGVDNIGENTTYSIMTVAQVQIVMVGDISDFTPNKRDAAIAALAAIVGIPANQVTFLRATAGSIILYVQMPLLAAEELQDLYSLNDPYLLDIGVLSIDITTKSRKPRMSKNRGDLKQTWGKLIRDLRTKRNMTRSELIYRYYRNIERNNPSFDEVEMNFNESSLARIEMGENRSTTIRQVNLLLDALQANTDERLWVLLQAEQDLLNAEEDVQIEEIFLRYFVLRISNNASAMTYLRNVIENGLPSQISDHDLLSIISNAINQANHENISRKDEQQLSIRNFLLKNPNNDRSD